ncbi:sugar ABC transporter permease [Parageobacillus thermoglucosidasius]|uniref:Xylose transport system permease protein XylH n=1 Tax=Parageobacillus thermoglucosidasius TaxID=1426 RepID=A0AB38R5B3_PARTM|nr:sugar ABC transporter permease [Parageobacillus thermoglucosidasius]REK59578.1 MAG: sugar ABC transporter permease [Geobacillus sp.]UOE77830.1 sugar ABC transporter permease [Parageobacillus thermoglucosidasius]BDG32394.1 xylose ABC transporter permease [Parageobacillus thermoglucosidasius]
MKSLVSFRASMDSEKRRRLLAKLDFRSYTLVIALVLIALIFGVLTDGEFLSSRNLSNLFMQMSVISILAIGMTLVIIAGHIDLSVGSVVGLTGGIAAILQVWYGWGTVSVIVVAIIVGALIGLWQGWWVSYRNVPAFIVTLGGMLIFRGILIGISNGETIAPLNKSFEAIGNSYLPYAVGYVLAIISIIMLFVFVNRNRKKRKLLGLTVHTKANDYGKAAIYSLCTLVLVYMLNRYYGIPIPMLIVVLLAILFVFIAVKTPFGRYIYAIGGNIEAAALSGINIKRVVLTIFVLMGALSGVAGIILTSRLNAATVSSGEMYELDAIAACVIGGTSLMGGRGNIIGAMIGALIMASIDNGMSMMNIETFWQFIVKGLILIIAVWIDISSKSRTN